MWARLRSWPSTALGVVAATVNGASQVLGCQHSATDWQVWLPSLLLLVWGAGLKAPR